MAQRDYVEKDYYAALGVSKNADQAEIAKAYRKLARELHPDARPNDARAEERFKAVGEAYSVLSNPEKRKEYDQVRQLVDSGAFRTDGGPGGFGGFPGSGPGAGGQAFDINDLLGGLFGQAGGPGGPGPGGQAGPFGGNRGRRSGARRGRDLATELTLAFDDAMAGVTTTLRVAGRATCSTCRGSGAAPGTSPITCTTCQGRGSVARDQGMFSFSEPCPTCGGSGQQIPTPCPTCKGTGAETRTRDIRARIPAGVKDGARIRLKGQGEPGTTGGQPGDLYVTVHVTPDELFGRRDDDLLLRVPVTFTEAALGTKITVPTLSDPVTLKVPAGSESGKTLRVRGKGVPKSGGGRGDLLVTLDVTVPRKLNRAQRKLLEELAATDGGSPREHLERRLREQQRV